MCKKLVFTVTLSLATFFFIGETSALVVFDLNEVIGRVRFQDSDVSISLQRAGPLQHRFYRVDSFPPPATMSITGLGDLIYTGPNDRLNPGDVVEVELEGVGLLRNTVTREK